MSHRPSIFGAGAADAWGGRARRRTENELDVTPMIDVTFLLLIFFMVTSTMQEPELDVPSARHGVGIDERSAIVVKIKDAKPAPTISVENETLDTLDELQERVKLAVADNRPEVIIRADGRLPHGFVQQIIKSVAAVEGSEFSIGVRDKRSE